MRLPFIPTHTLFEKYKTMIIDNQLSFSSGATFGDGAATGATDAVSTNVYNAGSAKSVFGGSGRAKVAIHVTAAAGTTPKFRARLVGADNAALTTNPEIISDTGLSAAITAGLLPLSYELVPSNQKVAKQYYGVIVVMGGADNTCTYSANVVETSQND